MFESRTLISREIRDHAFARSLRGICGRPLPVGPEDTRVVSLFPILLRCPASFLAIFQDTAVFAQMVNGR